MKRQIYKLAETRTKAHAISRHLSRDVINQ